MIRFSLSLPDDLAKHLADEAAQLNDSRNHHIFTILNEYRFRNEITLCGKYRLMILRLLDNGHRTNISQEIRNDAYDLLNEAFEDET